MNFMTLFAETQFSYVWGTGFDTNARWLDACLHIYRYIHIYIYIYIDI